MEAAWHPLPPIKVSRDFSLAPSAEPVVFLLLGGSASSHQLAAMVPEKCAVWTQGPHADNEASQALSQRLSQHAASPRLNPEAMLQHLAVRCLVHPPHKSTATATLHRKATTGLIIVFIP